MAGPHQIGSDVFRRLDAFMSEQAEDCNEAIAWLPSLTADDWQLLQSVWTERSVNWRANCACIVGQGPVTPSQPVLRLAIADSSDDVAQEAAIWFCKQAMEHPELVLLDDNLLTRLRDLKRRDERGTLFEVTEVLRRHGGV